MELLQSPVFHLFLLSTGMGLCVYLFITLKQSIFSIGWRGKRVEEFLSCILSDQLYWSKQITTDGHNGTTDPGRWVTDILADALAQGLEGSLGVKVEFDCFALEAGMPAGSADDCWWQTEFSDASGALVYCGCPAQVAGQIGSAVLTAVGVAEASAEDAKRIYRDIVGQSMSAIAQSLSGELKRAILCSNVRECRRPENCGLVFGVKLNAVHLRRSKHAGRPLTDVRGSETLQNYRAARVSKRPPGTKRATLVNGIGVKLVSPLQECGPIWLAVSREFESLFAPPAQAAPPAPIGGRSQPPRQKTKDLLLDVELPLCVSFGRTRLPLVDIVQLTKGSILDLNRSIAEPVELIVNDCVIARGQVVVMEENYGVRIQEIMSRRDLLRTLY